MAPPQSRTATRQLEVGHATIHTKLPFGLRLHSCWPSENSTALTTTWPTTVSFCKRSAQFCGNLPVVHVAAPIMHGGHGKPMLGVHEPAQCPGTMLIHHFKVT